MNWPSSQDYNEAIQNPASCFNDSALKGGAAAVNAIGLPMPCSGSFADVYQIKGGDGKMWAVKCFTRKVVGLQERYARIDEHLTKAMLPFTVGFSFVEEGIRVRGRWYPLLKMEWVEGLTLNKFVRDNADQPQYLHALLQMWTKLTVRLRESRLAHADLQHGNVLLVPGDAPNKLGLKLIDYDGMWAPTLANMHSGEVGHPNYQHPRRVKERLYNSDVDRYPHLVIASALRATLIGGRALWNRFDNGDNLLFKEEDLRRPGDSEIFRTLWNLNDDVLRATLGMLVLAIHEPINRTPWLDHILLGEGGARLNDDDEKKVIILLGDGRSYAGKAPVNLSLEEYGDFEIVDDLEDEEKSAPARRSDDNGRTEFNARPYAQRRPKSQSKAPFVIGGVSLAVILIAGIVALTSGAKKNDATPARDAVVRNSDFSRDVSRTATKRKEAEDERRAVEPPGMKHPSRDRIPIDPRPETIEDPADDALPVIGKQNPATRGNKEPLQPVNKYELADISVLAPPLPADPKLRRIGESVYLGDMTELAWIQGPPGWLFGKNGNLGDIAGNEVVVVDKKTPLHALSMPPPTRAFTRICYSVGKRAKTFEGAVAISEHSPSIRPHPMRFIVLGDGKLLWRSDSIKEHGVKQDFSIDVSEIGILELRVYAETNLNLGSYAVWIDPLVKVQAQNKRLGALYAYERPDPSVLEPKPADETLATAEATVFLSEMSEFGWKKGPPGWTFAKDGTIGEQAQPNKTILVLGKAPQHALAMHPPAGDYTRVCYSVAKRASTFDGAVAISEDTRKAAPQSVRFAVLGDGKLLWRSDAIRAPRTVEEFSIDVSDVGVLELRVYVEKNSNVACPAVWLDPQLKVKGAEALAKKEPQQPKTAEIKEVWNRKEYVPVNTLAFGADSEKVLAGSSASSAVRLFDVKDGGLIDSVEMKGTIQAVAPCTDDLIVVSDVLNRPSVWDVKKKARVFDFNGIQSPTNLVGCAKNGTVIIPDRVGRISVWSVADKNLVNDYQLPLRAPNRVQCVSCSSQGDYAVLVTAKNEVYSMTPASAGFKPIGVAARSSAVVMSPDGKTFLHASTEVTISIFETTTGKELRVLSGHAGVIKGFAFANDGQNVVSIANDATLRYWDAETAKQIQEIRLSGQPQCLAISPNNKFAATATVKDDVLQLWRLRDRPSAPISGGFNLADLKTKLEPKGPDHRGALVSASLPPLLKGEPLSDDALAKAIAELEKPETAPAAIKSLHNTEPDRKRQEQIARLLEKWAGQTDWNPMARADAATALRWWGTPESIKMLAALVADESAHSSHFRQPAMWSLAYLGGEKAAAVIAARIDDAFDRSAVVKMLQGMGSDAEPHAVALLESKSAENRGAAARILKIVGTKTSAPALFKVAETDPNESVRKEVRTALQAIALRQKDE